MNPNIYDELSSALKLLNSREAVGKPTYYEIKLAIIAVRKALIINMTGPDKVFHYQESKYYKVSEWLDDIDYAARVFDPEHNDTFAITWESILP